MSLWKPLKSDKLQNQTNKIIIALLWNDGAIFFQKYDDEFFFFICIFLESSGCLSSGIVIACCVIVAAAVGGGYYIYERKYVGNILETILNCECVLSV